MDNSHDLHRVSLAVATVLCNREHIRYLQRNSTVLTSHAFECSGNFGCGQQTSRTSTPNFRLSDVRRMCVVNTVRLTDTRKSRATDVVKPMSDKTPIYDSTVSMCYV